MPTDDQPPTEPTAGPEPADRPPGDAAPSDTAPPGNAPAGGDAVRSALARARAAAAERGLEPGRPAGRQRRRRGSGQRSGAGPDARDPQLLGSALNRLVAEAGWQVPVSVGGVFGRWEQIVGPQVAEHATPETFQDGKLVVRTSSTAWAAQLRLLRPQLLRRLTAELGAGVVTELTVLGPAAPSWKHGPRSAGGRGPRDTYG